MDKVTSYSYKTNVNDFLDNSHDLDPFESDISKHPQYSRHKQLEYNHPNNWPMGHIILERQT